MALPPLAASGTVPLTVNLTRAKLENLVDGLVQKTIGFCKLALRDAGLKPADIGEVVLAGGMTRMPMVRQAVTSFFNREPSENISPEEAAATGAAIQAGILQGDARNVLLLDVLSQSLGIETLGGVFTRIIDRNTTIPTMKHQMFSTAEDNQRGIQIRAFQGENPMAALNRRLGRFELDVPAAARGVPQIAVNFQVDASGIVSVSAVDKTISPGRPVRIRASGGLIATPD